MRKIEKLMIQAIHTKQSKSLGNTTVTYECELNEPMHSRLEMSKVYLYGHHIATYTHHNDTTTANPMTLARYPTRTTKSRLRALRVNVYTKNFTTYLNDKAI
jgi:hypothetical protein